MNDMSDIDMGLFPKRRVKPIRQSEAAECGLACLTMVANRWGHDYDLASVRTKFGVSSRGMGLQDVMDVADGLGMDTRPLRVDADALEHLSLPAILHWNMDHFVVVEKVKGEKAYIVDPANDGRWHDEASISKHFTGVALELRPNRSFVPETASRRLRLKQLWSGSHGMGRAIGQIAILSLVLQAYVLASPYFLQVAVDEALPALDSDLLIVLAAGFGLFAIVNAGATLLRSFTLLASGTAISYGLSSNIARRLMRLPVQWFEKRNVGDILGRFQSVQPIQKLLTESAGAAVIDGILALFTLVMMAVYSPMLACVPIAAMLAYSVVRGTTVAAERRAENERIVASGREQTAMIETLRGIVTLRLAGRETMRHATWQNRLSEALGARYAHERIHAWQQAASTLIVGIELVVLTWLAVRHAILGGMSVGMIFAFLAYRQQFSTATKSLIDNGTEFRLMSLHLERLSDIALEPEDTGFSEPTGERPDYSGEIELRGVVYAYAPNQPDVLKGVDIHIRPGEHVAITGTSGGGKSTLAKIILGLLDPDQGEVLIDDMPLSRYGRRAFRRHVGAVLQDDVLFAGTIADNVAGFGVVDEVQLEKALRAASVHDEIMAMPMRHHTLVGDMGGSLSGGQRQRILLARALYRQPRLLVMDEGTAHLDPMHERRVNAAISQMGITRIIIAHRRETIEAADRIIRLEGGTAKPG